jgi:hypothetical protein
VRTCFALTLCHLLVPLQSPVLSVEELEATLLDAMDACPECMEDAVSGWEEGGGDENGSEAFPGDVAQQPFGPATAPAHIVAAPGGLASGGGGGGDDEDGDGDVPVVEILEEDSQSEGPK